MTSHVPLSTTTAWEAAITYPGLDQRFIRCTAHLWEPLIFRKKWAAFFPLPSILHSASQTSSAGAWICISAFHISLVNTLFYGLSDSHLNPCSVVFTFIILCSHEPHKLWGTSNNNFVYYRPHFWLQHLASMVLSETAGKIIFLSPIYCWPIQPAESCMFWCGPAVVILTWNISNHLLFERELHAVFQAQDLYIAWWCNSDFSHSWCCFSPDEHGSNQSMPSNVSTRLHGHDFAA